MFSGVQEALGYADVCNVIEIVFAECYVISIGNGIMEYADNVYVCLVDLGWSDIFMQSMVYQYSRKDRDAIPNRKMNAAYITLIPAYFRCQKIK